MDECDDATLVRQSLGGDRAAFAELVRRHQDYAYGTAIGVLSDFDLAQDVVQEAFLCAYRDLRRLRQPQDFSRWLQGITKNLARRALRELQQLREMARRLGEA